MRTSQQKPSEAASSSKRPALFQSLKVRDLEIPNRVWLSPMCQYQVTAKDGVPTDWHLVHYGSRAVGGFGLITTESAAISPEGRISPQDVGLWNDEQALAWRRITDFIHEQGVCAGIQLQHAGRKASANPALPGFERKTLEPSEGGWATVAPSAVATPGYSVPRAMTPKDIEKCVDDFVSAARRAVEAGFDVVELHGAHGYLIHQFLSPIANKREDEYGGSFENRTRFLLEVVKAVRAAIPEGVPLMVRISATDWITSEPAWDVEQSVELARLLESAGVDIIDVSTGGVALADIPVVPSYQVPAALAVKDAVSIAVTGVGLITDAEQAERHVAVDGLDAVMIGREALRDAYWPLRAARELMGASSNELLPAAYHRAPLV